VAVRLADAAEVAGDGPRSAEVDVGAVDALGVQRLDAGRAQYLDRGADCGKVAAVGFLLFHLAHADEASGENLPLFHSLPDFGEQPREVLERADLERRGLGEVVVPHGALGVDAGAVVGEGDELPLVAERGQPFEVLHEGGVHPFQFLDERRHFSGFAGPFVDVAYRAVFGDDPPEVGEHGVFGVRQILVDLLENVRVDAELLKCHRCFLLIIVLGYKKPGASEMLISKTPGGSVRSVRRPTLREGRCTSSWRKSYRSAKHAKTGSIKSCSQDSFLFHGMEHSSREYRFCHFVMARSAMEPVACYRRTSAGCSARVAPAAHCSRAASASAVRLTPP